MRRRGDLLPLYRVDTSSLAISQVQLPSGYSVFGMAIAPSGNQAVIEGGVTSLTFYLFDTSTNTVTETFPLPPIPGNRPRFQRYRVQSRWYLAMDPDRLRRRRMHYDGRAKLPSGNVIAQTALPAPAYALTF